MALDKQLGFVHVFSIAAGAMISSGLFVLPAIAYRTAGSGILIAYLLAGILMLPALFSQLELATAIPRAGGTYFFAERILGTPAGVVAGFANWFSISLKAAFALVGIGAFTTLILPGIGEWEIKLIAATCCIVFAVFNLLSTRSSGLFQVILVAGLLTILALFVLLGYRVMDFSRLQQVMHFEWAQVLAVTGMVFISYGGLTKVASVAEEVRNPRRNLVRGSFAAFIVVQLFYLAIIVVLIGVLPGDRFGDSLTPLSEAARLFAPGTLLGKVGMSVTALAALLAFFTTANAGLMAASRAPLAMSRDNLIPDRFARLSRKRRMPRLSIIVTAAFMLSIILSLDIENLAKVASAFMLLLFAMVNLSVIVVRQSRIANYRPSFRSPLYPVPQVLGTLCYLYLIASMGGITVAIMGGFVLLALGWYLVYARKRVARTSAFLHMVQRVTNPDLVQDEVELEQELLDILLGRNEIVEDRFDQIIRKAIVLDFSRTIIREELFRTIGEALQERWRLDPEQVVKKLNQREAETSTLIYPGVAVPHAIPHIIIEGNNMFDIVLVRNKYGICWNEQQDVVYTAFCLLGSMDERNFHLRALMAIAQILQDPSFHREWMQARNEKELRSAVLLIKRKRG